MSSLGASQAADEFDDISDKVNRRWENGGLVVLEHETISLVRVVSMSEALLDDEEDDVNSSVVFAVEPLVSRELRFVRLLAHFLAMTSKVFDSPER